MTEGLSEEFKNMKQDFDANSSDEKTGNSEEFLTICQSLKSYKST